MEFRDHAAQHGMWVTCVDQSPKEAEGFDKVWDSVTKHLLARPPNSPPTLHFDSKCYELYHHTSLVSCLCIDKSNPNLLAVAIRNGIREVNIQHALRFRKRSESRTRILDPEATTWQDALHRFDKAEEGKPEDGDPAAAVLAAPTSIFTMAHESRSGTPTPKSPYSPIGEGEGPPGGFAGLSAPSALGKVPRTPLNPPVSPFLTANNPIEEAIGIDAWWTMRTRNMYRRHKTLVHSLSGDPDLPRRPSGLRKEPEPSGGKAAAPSLKQSSPTIFSAKEQEGGLDHEQKVRWIESHPFLPFYLAGGVDGAVNMYQFGLPRAVRTYRQPNNPQVSHIRFTGEGYKFGAADYAGNLLLWRFEASAASVNPYVSFQPHSSLTRDFTFLDSGTLLATVGNSDGAYHLRIFDTLLPQHQRLVHEVPIDHEPTCLVYSTVQQDLLYATKKGELVAFDVRQRKVRLSVRAHEKNIKAMALSPGDTFVATGGLDGDIKVWDVPGLTLQSNFAGLHPAHKSLGGAALVSTYGVTSVVFTHGYLYTCGADGRVVRRLFRAA